MKLGVSYNAFSGLELLEASIRSIRDVVDHVNVCYQIVSNTGIANNDILDYLLSLPDGLINSLTQAYPKKGLTPKQNETDKRNLGLMVCKSAGCTHFMSMDVDEFYKADQLKLAKKIIERHDFDTTVCKMQTYYKSASYKLDPPEEYFVPLIYKIDNRKFVNGMSWPVHADPSRKMQSNKFFIFKRDQIEMHHMSYVRNNIREKLYNASSSVNYKDRIEEIAEYYDNWKYPQMAYLGGSKKRLVNVVKCDTVFGV